MSKKITIRVKFAEYKPEKLNSRLVHCPGTEGNRSSWLAVLLLFSNFNTTFPPPGGAYILRLYLGKVSKFAASGISQNIRSYKSGLDTTLKQCAEVLMPSGWGLGTT
jgi:hypothetical protein